MATRSRSGASTESEPSSYRLGVHLLVVMAVAAALGAMLAGPHAARSAALGVGLCAVNLALMWRITRALTRSERGAALWALAFPMKLVALLGIAFFLVEANVAAAIPLAVGFAVLPLTSVFLPRPSSVRGAGDVPEASRLRAGTAAQDRPELHDLPPRA